MNILVSAVFVNTGIAKASGNPYQMNRAWVLVPFSGRNTPTSQSNGTGFTPVEISVSDAFFPDFEKEFLTQFKDAPVAMDLEHSMDSQGRMILIGFSGQSTAKPEPKLDENAPAPLFGKRANG